MGRRRSRAGPLAHPLAFLLTAFAVLPPFGASSSSLDQPRGGFLETVLEGSVSADQRSCQPTGQIKDACCDFESVEQVNSRLHDRLSEIVQLPIFRYHKVDLSRQCPYWEEDGFCGNRACAVDELDNSSIPEFWRSENLGKLTTANEGEIPIRFDNGCVVREQDFCVSDDDEQSHAVYVDLLANPERFTGYAGPSASRVWKAIYEENCFDLVPYLEGPSSGGERFISESQMGLLGATRGSKGQLGKLMGSVAAPRDGGEETCLEKRVFYRLISGLHASISIHICDEYLDPRTGTWVPNLQCFITRIAQHPERLQNVYFDYVIMLRALEKAGPHLLASFPPSSTPSSATAAHLSSPPDGLELCTGDDAVDTRTRQALNSLVQEAKSCPSTFDETSMFTGPGAVELKDEFKRHFRNVSRIMDCVGCDKCRLWGKLQVTGLGTALKLLFEFEDGGVDDRPRGPRLTRPELVAFINTLHRLSESLGAIDKFRLLWRQRSQDGTLPSSEKGEREDAAESEMAAKRAKVEAGLGPRAATNAGRDEGEKKRRRTKKKKPKSSVAPANQARPSSEAVEVGAGRGQEQQQDALSRLFDRCRSSWAVCFHWLERAISTLIGTASLGNGRRSRAVGGGEL